MIPPSTSFSLRRRLMLGLLVGLFAASLTFFLLIRTYANHAAERAFDRLLAASALSIADGVQIENGRLTADLPFASHSILAVNPMSRVFYRISAPDGAFITGYPDLGAQIPSMQDASPTFTDARFLDTEVRITAIGRFFADPAVGGWVTILVAETTEDRHAFAAEIVQAALVPALAIVVITAVFGWIAIQQALKPLATLEKAISVREPTDLAPIHAPVPREVEALVQALNTLMRRLAATFTRMQNFLGETAHQIRTPLAALRAQLEVALDEKDIESVEERLHRAHRNAVAITHLTNQLLADTMVAHRSEAKPLVPIDLMTMAVHTLADIKAADHDPPITLNGPEEGAAILILGDDVMLAEALKNIIENARKYSGGNEPVVVTITEDKSDGTVRLSVTDNGPGIAPEDRKRVLERFTRGEKAEGTVGSGLGLAIAARVAARHGGTLDFYGEAGAFTVTLFLPRYREDAT